MDVRKNVRVVRLGILLGLLLGGVKAGVAEAQTAEKVAPSPQAPATDANPDENMPKEVGDENAAPPVPRAETDEKKSKGQRFAESKQATPSASRKRDAGNVKSEGVRKKAWYGAEKSGKAEEKAPAEGNRAK